MSFEEKLDILSSALKIKDKMQLRAMGHKLHGSGASYGFKKITELGRTINAYAHDENWDGIKEQINLLKDFVNKEKKQRGLN